MPFYFNGEVILILSLQKMYNVLYLYLLPYVTLNRQFVATSRQNLTQNSIGNGVYGLNQRAQWLFYLILRRKWTQRIT